MCPIVEGYGLSETSPVATSNRLDVQEFSATIGLPIPSTDIAIRDDDGCDVSPSSAGEICIRGPQVMRGYWLQPEKAWRVTTDDCFFKSGGVGVMDDRGCILIVDRKKDMIRVSGFNAYPTEIEQVVNQCSGVLECAAVGILDEKSSEGVKPFVVMQHSAIQQSYVANYCRDNFTAYKRPK